MTPRGNEHIAESTPLTSAVNANIQKVEQFVQREEDRRTASQRAIERISLFFGNPRFLMGFVASCIVWVVLDLSFHALGHPYFDAPPFSILQGVITFIGVLITMAVLTRQNRLARVEEERAHMELQINLLAEQKTTKIITLLEELRRDMPNVQDRHDEHAATLQAATNPEAVLRAMENRKRKE